MITAALNLSEDTQTCVTLVEMFGFYKMIDEAEGRKSHF